MTGASVSSFAASADLWQARNGPASSPVSPVDWVRGNVGPANSHYVEGNSIPYRMVMSGLSAGQHMLVIEWDTRQKGKHAIDFLTHYNRLSPHSQFGSHSQPEAIKPLDGLTGPFSAPASFAVPAPAPTGSPIVGLPGSAFVALPETERALTIWNGAITRVAYLEQGSLTSESAVTRLEVVFVADRDTVVLAWGGHIASKLDWGAGNAATSIGGSPYHMRKISLDGAGGNQDRSLQAIAVASPPTSTLSGPGTVCALNTNAFVVTTDSTDPAAMFAWTIANNTAGAQFNGPANAPRVEVITTTGGIFTLEAKVSVGTMNGVSTATVTSRATTTVAPIADQTACPGTTVTLSAQAGGAGTLAYQWFKDAKPFAGATGPELTLPDVHPASSGHYCVMVIGDCGTATACATLTVQAPPIVSGPPPLLRECLTEVPPADMSSVTASGAANPITISHAGDQLTTNGCDILVRRTYLATDACGSQSGWVQEITVRDTHPPIFAALPDRRVEVGIEWSFDPATASDVCDATVAPVVLGTVTNAICGSSLSATRTWQAADRCGNVATLSQTIRVVDTTAPTINPLPAASTIDCPAKTTFAQATVFDAGDPAVVITFADVITPGDCAHRYSVTRTWTASDACGNTNTASQTIVVQDTTPPVIAALPAPTTIECPVQPAFAQAIATDACDAAPLLTFIDVTTAGDCPGRYSITRTWTATDACGNASTASQTISVQDTTHPVIAALPAPTTIEAPAKPAFATATATDACDAAPTLTFNDVTTAGDCPSRYSVTRTWTATDACGHVSIASQTVSVQDTMPPVFESLPAPPTIDCPAKPAFAQAVATDAASAETTLTFEDVTTPGVNAANYSVTRTWIATDACGNHSTSTQTFRVQDVTAPAIVCPENLSVRTLGPDGAPVGFGVMATDACDDAVTITTSAVPGSMFALGITVVQGTATDASGNRSECSFTITVFDDEPPTITCPADVAVLESEAGSSQALVAFHSPIVTDNADRAPVAIATPPSGSVFPLGDTTVRWVATDASGNSSSCSFVVRVVPRTVVANNLGDSGPGSLRQALIDANAARGTNVIEFAFPGTPPFVIHLLSPLPEIVDSVVVDGWSQLEFRGQPVIELDGTNVVAGTNAPAGLSITAGGVEVRGLTLNGFAVGLRLAGPGGNVVVGNFIGGDPSGATPPGNVLDGLQLFSPNNRIGGTTEAERNVISGNRGHGIVIAGPAATNNVIRGNWIGPASADSSAPGNDGNGITLRDGAARNRIGPDNVIAGNRLNGVLLEPTAASGNAIRGNSIYSNGALGIDLGGDGTTPNDDEDVDSGPNQLQNIPVLTSAQLSGETTIVAGTLNGTSNSVFQIDLFLNATNDPTGFGKGETFLGSITVETDASGHGEFTATLPVTVPANQFITATATDAANNTSEFSLAAQVGGAPVIITNPVGSAVTPGGSLTVCVTAAGSQPLTFQWRLNGANIPDATNTCFTIENAQLTDGGSYTVVVANDLGVVTSDPAVLRLILPRAAIADNFSDRVLLGGVNGLVAWNNTNATLELSEPNHAGKPGGKSIWYKWVAPSTGVATFSAVGSAFDTLLAVYTGGSITNLTLVESDEDRGGFFTSIVRFNAVAGTEYQIAIDGFGGASGEFVFSWAFESSNQLLPVIFTPPRNQTVIAGASVTFTVDASVDCREPHYNCRRINKDQPPDHPLNRDPLNYQWYFNGVAIPGATRSSWTVTNVQNTSVGFYTVQVTGDTRTVETVPVSLQINETGPNAQFVQAKDKFLDAANSTPLSLGNPSTLFSASADSGETPITAAAIVRSYTSTQVFSSAGGTTSEGERLLCYGVGGASEWFAVVTEEAGTLYVDTDGSSYDTVMAVYTYAPANAGLALLGCDNNSGKDGKDSALSVPVQARQTNFVVIDGYNGASGVASLHFSLVAPASLKPNGFTAQKAFKLRLTGQPAMRFTIQASTNFVNWTPLLTNTSATGSFDYTDPKSTNAPRRFYRALMLP